MALKIVELKRVAFCCCNFYLQLSEKRKILQKKQCVFLLKMKRSSMVKTSPKIKCFLALYSVGFWGGIPPAFENTSHDRYFSNKKSVIDVVFTEICPIHYPTLNEAAQSQIRPFIICSSSIISPTVNWAVFDEGPSGGFKIRINVWGVVRANENPLFFQ